MNGEHPLPSSKECEIFDHARNLTSLKERAEYLDQACGEDHALRASIEALLNNDSSGDTLEASMKKIRMSSCPCERIGDFVGHYKLLEIIGEGGCGVVYLAEQLDPFVRRVALKIIKPGFDIKQLTRRFETERQALAMLNHSNIARVYEAGTTDDGRPYFAMEFINGENITDYADRHQLGINERLNLFITVCLALHHAHEKGFVHRDIKPSNILVTEENGKPLPKIIDFGVAKVMFPLSNKSDTSPTITGQFIGTPAYTSPEQARCNSCVIDRRSDIYSLGLLFYELLVGCLPPPISGAKINIETLASAKVVVPPSMMLLRPEKKEYLKVLKCCRIKKTTYLRILRNHLDTMVMKCLESDPLNRYQTANELASDIHNYLQSTTNKLARLSYRQLKPFFLVLIVLAGLITTIALIKSSSQHTSPSPVERQSETNQEISQKGNTAVVPKYEGTQTKTTNGLATSQIQYTNNIAQSSSSLIATNANKELSPEEKDFLKNQEIYKKGNTAVDAPTFEGAKFILDGIEVNKITDADLASYIAICKEITDFCIEVGIPRTSSPNLSDIIKDADWLKLAKNGALHPIETIQKGRKIKNEIPLFEALDQKLRMRYSKQ